MSNATVKKLKFLEAKRKYSKFLRTNKKKQINEYAQYGLLAAISEPLKDIFTSLKLTAMDISNSLQLFLKTIWYVRDPEKLKEANEEYELKRSKILKDWGPVVERSMDALNNTDPFLTMMIAPQATMVSSTLRAGIAAGKNAAEIIAAEDWESIRSKINRVPDEEWGLGALMSKQKDQAKETNTVLTNLYNLFHSQQAPPQAAQNESLLREQNEKEQTAITDPQEWLEIFFRETGIADELTDAGAEVLMEKTVLAKDAVEQLSQNIAVMKLIAANNFEEFTQTISEIMTDQNLSNESVNQFKEMIPMLEDQAKQIASNSSYAEELSSVLKKPVEEISNDELQTNAMNFVFMKAKEQFDEQNKKSMGPQIKILEEIHDAIYLDQETLLLVNQRKNDLFSAPDFLKVYSQYENLYKEFNDLLTQINF